MAIAYKSVGTTTATGATAAIFDYPNGITAGDMIVLGVVAKYPPNGPATFTGFTAPDNARGTGGAGTPTTDKGTVITAAYYRVATGTETGKGTVISASANSSGANVVVFSPTSTQYDWATPQAGYGVDSTAGTGWVTVAGSAMDIVQGDMMVVVSGVNGDASSFSAENLSMGGITGWASHTERVDVAITGGQDTRLVVSHHLATAGTATTAGTFTMTASGTLAGGVSIQMRLREYWARGTAAPAEATQSQTGDASGAAAIYVVASEEATQDQVMDVPDATFQEEGGGPVTVQPAEATQSQTGDASSGKGVYVIASAESTQSQTGDASAGKGIYVRAPAEATQSQAGDASSGKGIYVVSCAESTQNQLSDASTGISVSVSASGESTQSQAMDTPTVKAIYVIDPVDGSQTQVMDELVANFFSPAWTATADPDEGYQLQFMDDMTVSFTIPPSGIGSRVPIFAQSRSIIQTGYRTVRANKRDDIVSKRG